MAPVLYPVPREGEGSLALMAMPRPGDGLAADVAALVAAGVTDVVCLLADDEMDRLGLGSEAEVVAAHGLGWHRLPTPDFGLPDGEEAAAVAAEVVDLLTQGASVVVHCRGGIGRSSTLAAIVLMLDGLDERTAWKVLREAGWCASSRSAPRQPSTSGPGTFCPPERQG